MKQDLLWNSFSRNLFSPSSPTFQPGGLVFPGPSQPLTKTTSTLGPRAIAWSKAMHAHIALLPCWRTGTELKPTRLSRRDKRSSSHRRLRRRQNSHNGFGIVDSIWSHVRTLCKQYGCSVVKNTIYTKSNCWYAHNVTKSIQDVLFLLSCSGKQSMYTQTAKRNLHPAVGKSWRNE